MSETQNLSFEILQDPQNTEVLFGGSAGGAKSFFVCLWALMECRNYPGIAIGLGRKELKRLKQTTLITLLNKVHPIMGVKEGDYKFNSQEGYIQYMNGSRIILIDMAPAPTDPDFDKFGSLELTHVIIEEVGEAVKKAVTVLGSRRGRMLNKEYGIVGKLVMTCNPTQNFIRQDYYKPYSEMGGGRIQKWTFGEIIDPRDSVRKPGYRVFIRSSVYDNPFVDPNYIEFLKNLPPMERKRLLSGDWNYADDDNTLFPALLLDRATTYELPERGEGFNKFIGVDVADKGKDKTVATLMVDGVIITQKELEIDRTGEKPLSYLYANELIKFAQQNGFNSSLARNIAVEGNGVGVGIRDALRIRGWYINVYEANGQSRSQGYYQFMLDMDAGAVKLLTDMDDGELREELAAHTYEMVDMKPKVIRKEILKQVLGKSPDKADSAMISNWAKNQQTKRASSSRIRF